MNLALNDTCQAKILKIFSIEVRIRIDFLKTFEWLLYLEGGLSDIGGFFWLGMPPPPPPPAHMSPVESESPL